MRKPRSGGAGVEGERGWDSVRRIVGRKRHALTNTDGRLLVTGTSPADLHDTHGGIAVLRASRGRFPFLAHCFADRAYSGERVGTATAVVVEIVAPETGQKGFAIQPIRYVIECNRRSEATALRANIAGWAHGSRSRGRAAGSPRRCG